MTDVPGVKVSVTVGVTVNVYAEVDVVVAVKVGEGTNSYAPMSMIPSCGLAIPTLS